MKTYLKNFRHEYLDRLLSIVWDQWSTLGVSGQGKPVGRYVIDPEALLLFSSSIARYDARLFDAILEWLRINGRFINVTRISQIIKHEKFVGKGVLRSTIAAVDTSDSGLKWNKFLSGTSDVPIEPENLFFQKSGNPLPVIRERDPLFESYGFIREVFRERGVSAPFRPERPGNLLLRLRAFMGVNARSEILFYLLLHPKGSPRAMARDCYYFPATISKALSEIEQSGILVSRNEGRYRFYSFRNADEWKSIFLEKEAKLSWITWPRLFSVFERIWLFLDENVQMDKTALEQASSLRRVLRDSAADQLENCGLPVIFGRDSDYPGEELIPFFLERMRAILGYLESL
ncbi:hypothetical protein JW823_09655 [bacterium]|nr:hypothetical protein [candidate division CSSED10-310 bacterium]